MPHFFPVNVFLSLKLQGRWWVWDKVLLTCSNQRGRSSWSLCIHTGACILIGCLLLSGLDKSCGLGAGWLSYWCGCVRQTGAGRVYRAQHCRKKYYNTLTHVRTSSKSTIYPLPTKHTVYFFMVRLKKTVFSSSSPSWLSVCVVGMTVAVGVGMGTAAGVTIGRMLARGVALLPVEGLGLLLGDGVLGVGRMLAVGGSDRLELKRRKPWNFFILCKFSCAIIFLCFFYTIVNNVV